jgi:hypothetical protein
MFGWLKKIGKGAWWVAKRPETRLVTQVAVKSFWPAMLLNVAVNVAKIAEAKNMTGEEKKAWAITQIAEFALRMGLEKESDINKLVEDALAVVERRAQMEP